LARLLQSPGLYANCIKEDEPKSWFRASWFRARSARRQYAEKLPGIMKGFITPRLEADGPNAQTGFPLPVRDRVLEAACELFAETGFHGTHLREICKRAGTNVAGVCYHFQSKEGLYRAVLMEAGRRLSERDENLAASCAHLSPDQRLPKLVYSLVQKLSARRAWIAKLLARELVDPACGAHTYVASGLERDFVLLQAVLRDLLGLDASKEAIRLHALSLTGESVFYCLAGSNPHYPLAQLAVGLPTRARFAQFLMERLLGTLESDRRGSELFQGNQALQTDLPRKNRRSIKQHKSLDPNHTTETENLPQTGSQHL
jgi:AcrR family transcriptional regulator